MAKQNTMTSATENLESSVSALETRMATLEQLSKRVVRKKREYTDEQRATIRARLVAGLKAAQKKREAEAKAAKRVKAGDSESVKAVWRPDLARFKGTPGIKCAALESNVKVCNDGGKLDWQV